MTGPKTEIDQLVTSLAAKGFTLEEIARETGLPVDHLRRKYRHAIKAGLLRYKSALERLQRAVRDVIAMRDRDGSTKKED